MMQQLFFGGTILTMNENKPQAEALLVQDGEILLCGSEKEARAAAAQDCTKIDLQGKTLMPSFIDAHSHFLSYAISLLQVPLENARSFSDIIQSIQSYIHKNKIQPGEWVLCKGYDHNNLDEKEPPDFTVLDLAAPENPVLIQHQSGHTGVCNSLALQALGINADTPDPAGGRIGRKNGILTGYLEENAYMQAAQKTPMPSPEKIFASIETAQRRYAAQGITTLQEGMMPDAMTPLYAAVLAQKKLWLDVVGYADLRNCKQIVTQLGGISRTYHDRFRLGGYKIFLDGSPQARTAWLRKPYEGSEDCGYPVLSNAAIDDFVQTAVADHAQLLAHCNGDAAAQQYLDAYTAAVKKDPQAKELRPVMIHAQLLGRDQLPALKACGMIPSFFVAHVYHWGDVHLRNFGAERAEAISPAASALKEGIRFTFHQDAPVIEPNMLETVWCAVNRITKQGITLGAQERISTAQALRAVTVNAAYQYFEEKKKGTLEKGKHADMIILSENPLVCEPLRLREIRVLATFKEGKCVYSV